MTVSPTAKPAREQRADDHPKPSPLHRRPARNTQLSRQPALAIVGQEGSSSAGVRAWIGAPAAYNRIIGL